MCGIAGILKTDAHERVDKLRLERMRDVLRHRGPDGEGLLLDGPAGLAHRRLAIVDVAGGHQPMSNEDGTIWITFNGEIYNHAALRPGLEARGHVYRTRSDTETILHLYEEEGERCVERLQGMFAFAIWDRPRQKLLLARDRLGIKPLYYAVTPSELLFGSEIKALLAAGVRADLNRAALPELLAAGYVSGPETLFQGVRRLPPGRTLSWTLGQGGQERQYWALPAPEEDGEPMLAERAREVGRRLQSAVRSHLMSDVPLGLFLSGGIDSSGLLALMAPMVKEPVRTFSVGFTDREANELAYARVAARAAGAEHREVVVSPDEFFDALPRLVWHEDEPIAFPSSVPLHFVSVLAAQHVKVVLTGEGADELFLGYNRYRVTAWNQRLGETYRRMTGPWFRARLRDVTQQMPRSMRRYTERSFLALDPGPRGIFYENFAVFPEVRRQALLADAALLLGRDPYFEALRCYEEAKGGPLDRMSRADIQTYLVRLLMKQDTMSMAASIESRVPFLDHELVEHIVSMPGRFKLRGLETKAVLRAALQGVVPAEILTRKKMGFPVPVGRWLSGSFWPMVQEFVLGPRAAARGLFDPSTLRRLANEHRSGQASHGDRLWLLLNLEIWHRLFVDGEDAAAVMRAA
jgi:asparagine synthase (glutamine-hydrolysing)